MNALAAALLAATCLALTLLIRRPARPELIPALVGDDTEPTNVPEASPAVGQGERPAASAALVADAAAALLRSGTSLPRALACLGAPEGPAPELAAVADLLAWGADPAQAWAAAPEHSGLRDAMALAESTGAPVAVVLNRRAHEQRREAARDEEARAASLAVRLVMPMGLCGLPAFICLGIVPLGLALLPL